MLNTVINIDLHIHSKASAYKEKGAIVAESDQEHIDVLLDRLSENRIDMFSITDHNRFDSALYFAAKEQIRQRALPLTVLSGVEFDVRFEANMKAAHIIVIFDTRQDDDLIAIESAINKAKIIDAAAAYDLEEFEQLLASIKLNTILIAHQHSGFGGTQRKRSLGAASGKAKELYRFGYIDALEYNTPTVQGILRSELSELDLPQRMLIGSDCHEWACYPKHESNDKTPDAFYAQIKALPTFRGLLLALTSSDTRIGVPESHMKEQYLESLEVLGKTVPMSPGLNVIIGENGIGKSSFLAYVHGAGKKKSWEKSIKERYCLDCKPLRDEDHIFVGQGYLQDQYHEDKVFGDELFSSISHDEFESVITAFATSLKARIRDNIRRRIHESLASETAIRIDASFEGKTFSFTVTCADNFTQVENPFESPSKELDSIRLKLDAELQRESIYTAEELDLLTQAKNNIETVHDRILSDYQNKNLEGTVKGIIADSIDSYGRKITSRSNDDDRKKNEYREAKAKFINTVVALAADHVKQPVTLKPTTLSPEAGVSSKQSYGFKFVKSARYSRNDSIEDSFVGSFNTAYRDINRLSNIDDVQAIVTALPGCTSASCWETFFDSLVSKYKDDQKEETRTIMDVDQFTTGNTLGEMALSYYRYKTNAQTGVPVFVADQPEDNISNKRIQMYLTGYFNSLRYRAQVILVTHNPLLVVNQDVDNVIVLKSSKDGMADVSFGCLESQENGSVLEDIAEIMDGGKEAIQKRVKVYGTTYNN